MHPDLHIHYKSFPFRLTGAVGQVNGVIKNSTIAALLAHARGILEEVVMEAHLIAGAFRAARSYGGDPLGSNFPVIPDIWFRG